MVVHFICSGNTYRSRLAEAYLNSQNIQEISAISSGIDASEKAIYPIRWYTEKIIEENNLEKYASPSWQQASQELIHGSSFVVFMSQDIFEKCARFELGRPYEVWDISDVNLAKSDNEIIIDTNNTFSEIKKSVKNLVQRIKQNGIIS